jgi:G3E family GTPase
LLVNTTHNKIKAVPTNIITGFLGVGKTSVILHLLKSKPTNERWAVLVNEFGEIGIDGSLLQGQHAQEQGVFIREVPGGCMCCASGLPMQIALNQLLARAKPDRLLIEPTGLGHPIEVRQVLSAKHYQDILSLQRIITLVDARKLKDERYTQHETFNQQISIADVIIGNKRDLYQKTDQARLGQYIKSHVSDTTPVIFTQHGQIDFDLLNGPTTFVAAQHQHQHHNHNHKTKETALTSEALIPECGYLKAQNHGEGYESIGWRFLPDRIFSHKKLLVFLNGLVAERMKGVFISDNGVFGYNLTPDALTEVALDDCVESRIEIIGTGFSETLEAELMSCLTGDS